MIKASKNILFLLTTISVFMWFQQLNFHFELLIIFIIIILNIIWWINYEDCRYAWYEYPFYTNMFWMLSNWLYLCVLSAGWGGGIYRWVSGLSTSSLKEKHTDTHTLKHTSWHLFIEHCYYKKKKKKSILVRFYIPGGKGGIIF